MMAERDTGRGAPADDRPVYMISVAAQLAGVHPQTLRIYERRELIMPKRTPGGTRIYSDVDIGRVRLIQELTQEFGLNLAGAQRVMRLQDEIEALQETLESMEARLGQARDEVLAAVDAARRQYRREIVISRAQPPARRQT
jgi:MerR family transcriptional regulator, heat shock protein HspR